MIKKIKWNRKRIFNNNGYTIPMALVLMLLLLAFASSLLLVAFYNYRNSFVRHQYDQTYVYAKGIVEENTRKIVAGEFNDVIDRVIQDVNDKGTTDNKYADKYAKEYNFTLNLNDGQYIENSFNGEKIELEMKCTYYPQSPDTYLTSDYLSIGDRMKIVYIVKKTSKKDGLEIEYNINADYYCSKDSNRNPDGTPVASSAMESVTNMKWTLDKYTGNIYTEK
jgi:hypothetical protein